MKKITLLMLVLCATMVEAQDYYYFHSDYEDGTLQNWSNSDGTITNISNVESNGFPGDERMLQKMSDGSNTPLGVMEIVIKPENGNPFSWHVIGCGGSGQDCFSASEVHKKNENDFVLLLHQGLKDVNGNRAVYNQSMNIPSLSDWTLDFFENNGANYVFLDPDFDFNNVMEVKYFHTDRPTHTYEG